MIAGFAETGGDGCTHAVILSFVLEWARQPLQSIRAPRLRLASGKAGTRQIRIDYMPWHLVMPWGGSIDRPRSGLHPRDARRRCSIMWPHQWIW